MVITHLYVLGDNIIVVEYLMLQFVFYVLNVLLIPYLHILEIVELDLVELDRIDK